MREQRIHLTSEVAGSIDLTEFEERLAGIEHRLEIQDRHLNILNENIGVLMADLTRLSDVANQAVALIQHLAASSTTDQGTVDAIAATLADAVAAHTPPPPAN